MSLVPYYSDSDEDNDKEENNNNKELILPSNILFNKYSKTPLFANKVSTSSNSTETTFIYLKIEPSNDNLETFQQIFNQFENKSDIRIDVNCLINPLTKLPDELHLTLCYNMTLSTKEMNSLIETLSNDNVLQSIDLPKSVTFSRIQILENKYISLIADENSTLNTISERLTYHKFPLSQLLHVTVHILPEAKEEEEEEEVSTIKIDEPLTLQATRLCITRGRKIIEI